MAQATRSRGARPSKKSVRLSSTRKPIASRVSRVAEPRCGSMTRLSASSSCVRDLRFTVEHIQTRTTDGAEPQGLRQGVFVDHFAARGVDQEGIGAHQVQPAGVDQMAVCRTTWAMQRDEIALRQQLVDRRHLHGVVARQHLRRHGRAVLHQDLHAKAEMRALRHGLTDPAKADDAQASPPRPWCRSNGSAASPTSRRRAIRVRPRPRGAPPSASASWRYRRCIPTARRACWSRRCRGFSRRRCRYGHSRRRSWPGSLCAGRAGRRPAAGRRSVTVGRMASYLPMASRKSLSDSGRVRDVQVRSKIPAISPRPPPASAASQGPWVLPSVPLPTRLSCQARAPRFRRSPRGSRPRSLRRRTGFRPFPTHFRRRPR